ncbi:MAG: PA14 domain-containing protein, partial [Thermoguttaceae bacterium]
MSRGNSCFVLLGVLTSALTKAASQARAVSNAWRTLTRQQRKLVKSVALMALATALAVQAAPPVSAASLTWTGSTNNSWSLAGSDVNWSGSSPYTDGIDAYFDDSSSITGITIAPPGVQPSSITFANINNFYTFSGAAIGGAGMVTLSGSGSVAFNSANTYTGGTSINSGTLQLGNANALQYSTVTLNAASGGLAFASGPGTFNLNGLAGSGSFALSNASGNPVTLQVGGNGASTTFAGNIAASGGTLAKVGGGVLTLSGSNLYSGGTIISGGTLAPATVNSLGSGNIYLAGGTLRPNNGGAPGLTAQYYENNYPGHISSASLANFYSTYVNAMTLKLTDNITQDVVGGTTGVFSFDTNNAGSHFPSPYNYGAGGVTIPPGSAQVNNWAAMYTGYFYAATGGQYSFSTSSDDDSRVWINNVDAAVVVNGTVGQGEPGNPTITPVTLAAGTYNPITVGYDEGNGGFGLQVFYTPPGGAQATIPMSLLTVAAPSTFANNVVVNSNSTLDLGALTTAPNTSFNSLSIGATGANTLHVIGGGTATASFGSTNIVNTPTFDVQGFNVLNLGPIMGAGGLNKNGSGTLLMSASSNYTGGTTINLGTVQVNNAASMGAAGPSNVVAINNGILEVVAGFSDSNQIVFNAPGAALQVDAGQTYSNSTTFRVTLGSAVNKTGPGTLLMQTPTLLPRANLTANGGTIDLGGQTHTVGAVSFSGVSVTGGSLAGASYVVNSGATTVTASLLNNVPLTINSGGTLNVANAGAQTLGPAVLSLNGGNLTIGTNLAANGLTAKFYTPDPSLGTGTANTPNQALFNTLSGINSFIANTATLVYTTNTSAGSGVGMNFPNQNGGNPFTSINYTGADYYTGIFTGYINIPTTGTYTFSTQSDDGSVLFLDNNNTPVVNNNFYQGMRTQASTAQSLAAGNHPITIAYYQGMGGAGLIACADASGTNYIPNSQLSSFVPTNPTSYTNSVALTADSSITPYGSVTMGGLSIGSNQLHVVAGQGVGLTFSGPTTLSGSPNFNLDANVSLVLQGAVSDGGSPRTITESGAGLLALTNPADSLMAGSNFQLSGGSLQVIGQQSPLGGPATGPLGAASVTLNGGALVLTATSTTPITFDVNQGNAVTLSSTGSGGAILAANLGSTAGSNSGTVTLVGSNGGLVVPTGQTLNLGVANGYTLNIDHGLVLNNSGTISVGPGSVSLSASNNGNLSQSVGTLTAVSGGILTLLDPMSSGYYAPAATGTVVLASTYSGLLANLAPASGGTLVINSNVTAGTLNVAGGGYFANNSSSFGPTTTTLSLNGGTLGATTALTGSNAVANPLTWGATPTLNFSGASNLELSGSLGLTSGTCNLNDPATHGTLSGVISGSGGLNITGYPTLTGSNTYSGGTTLNNATNVAIYNNRAFGTGTITFNNGGFQATTTPLTGANAVANPWTIAAGSAAYFNGANAYQLSGSASLATGNESIHVTNPALTVTLSGVISGTGATLIRATDAANQSNGTVVISNSGNTFGGGFTLQSLGGNIDVQGASTTLSSGTVGSGPLGTGTITLGSANNGWINLENTAPVAVTLANPMRIYDACGYASVAGLTFSGPVTLTGPGNNGTNGIIDFWLGTN